MHYWFDNFYREIHAEKQTVTKLKACSCKSVTLENFKSEKKEHDSFMLFHLYSKPDFPHIYLKICGYL